jgi:hypothetical protein
MTTTTSDRKDPGRTIAVLHPLVPMPEFAFFSGGDNSSLNLIPPVGNDYCIPIVLNIGSVVDKLIL